MRLGANFDDKFTTEEEWDLKIKDLGVEVLMSAVTADTDAETVDRYIRWVSGTGLEIAEVGVWNNTVSADEAQRKAAIAKAQKTLALADRMHASCCVNISGGGASIGMDMIPVTSAGKRMIWSLRRCARLLTP